jgi:hypothetical protein
MGETYQSLAKGIDKAESVTSAILIIGICAGIVWLRARVRRRILEKEK